MAEWQDIAGAPKNGTHVRIKNDCMERSVIGKWGRYKSRDLPWLPESDEWVLVEDDLEEFMPMRPGTLVCPTHWQPIPEPAPTGPQP